MTARPLSSYGGQEKVEQKKEEGKKEERSGPKGTFGGRALPGMVVVEMEKKKEKKVEEVKKIEEVQEVKEVEEKKKEHKEVTKKTRVVGESCFPCRRVVSLFSQLTPNSVSSSRYLQILPSPKSPSKPFSLPSPPQQQQEHHPPSPSPSKSSPSPTPPLKPPPSPRPRPKRRGSSTSPNSSLLCIVRRARRRGW